MLNPDGILELVDTKESDIVGSDQSRRLAFQDDLAPLGLPDFTAG
jgi:hypothetical protein